MNLFEFLPFTALLLIVLFPITAWNELLRRNAGSKVFTLIRLCSMVKLARILRVGESVHQKSTTRTITSIRVTINGLSQCCLYRLFFFMHLVLFGIFGKTAWCRSLSIKQVTLKYSYSLVWLFYVYCDLNESQIIRLSQKNGCSKKIISCAFWKKFRVSNTDSMQSNTFFVRFCPAVHW